MGKTYTIQVNYMGAWINKEKTYNYEMGRDFIFNHTIFGIYKSARMIDEKNKVIYQYNKKLIKKQNKRSK